MKITERHLKERTIQVNRDLKVLGVPVGLRVDRNPPKGYSIEQVLRSGGQGEVGLREATAAEASAYIDGFFNACKTLNNKDADVMAIPI